MQNPIDHKIDLNDYLNRGNLLTEQSNLASVDLDCLSTYELVRLFSSEDLIPQKAVSKAIPQIINAIDSITKRLSNSGKMYYLGAGTSGRLGVLDAAELPPTFCSSPELVQGIIAGGPNALLKSSEGLEDIGVLAIDELSKRGFTSKDVLLGITAGGTTPFVKHALEYARSCGGLTIAISCVPLEQAKLICDIDIRLLTGPELLTGSTRLKAGTATKMTLNIISTAIMIRLGKVYRNMMIDVNASNNKLVDRAIRIMNELTDIDRPEAISLLAKTNGSVKLALLMVLGELDLDSAKRLLIESNDNLRIALKLSCGT